MDFRSKGAELYDKASLLKAYEMMLLIRRFEERSAQLYGSGLIGGFCHLYIGQEAVVTGLEASKRAPDTVITAYRDHGHMLACGMDPKGVMAELTGRETGYSKGKGGSMHMFSREKKFFGGHGIVGAGTALGTGLALGHKLLKDGGITFAYMGDGASNQGQVHESFNMAVLLNLPVIYIIEDNGYAMGTSVKRHAANTDLSQRGAAFGIPGYTIDGMDLLTVRGAADFAVNHVASGKGPIILHAKTYRYRGHSMSDPGNYRSKEEIEKYREHNDPILNLKTYFFENDMFDNDTLDEIDEHAKDISKEAAEFAQTSKEPDESELYTDVEVK